MSANPICEVNTDLPVNFDFKKLVENFKYDKIKEEEVVEEEKGPRDFLSKPDENWVVLPMFKGHKDHLRPSISLRTNPYMRIRYRNFLNTVSDGFVTISLVEPNLNTSKPRKKSLNGQFYGVDYKLAPIPILANPRNYTGSRSIKSKHVVK